MGSPLQIQLAAPAEIPALTAMSRRAFDSDILVGAPEVGGPPDYDSAAWHEKMRAKGHLYAISREGRLIGGVILFPNHQEKSMYLGRIFLDPEFHGRGWGTEAMKQLFRQFPETTAWYLDTPVWNVRTNGFYPKLGFAETARDSQSVNYCRTTAQNP